jgi:uncharacterized protein YecE (DUF72 family)
VPTGGPKGATGASDRQPRPGPGGAIRVGISGWTYPPWRGVFYPAGLAHRLELPYVAEHLNSLEINGTFYALQRPPSFQAWHDATGPDFVFSVKAPRFITHMKRLAGVEVALANFFASGVLALRAKLGPVMWQLPPNMRYDPGRLRDFFVQLPRNTTAAVALAAGHEERLSGRAWLQTDLDRPVRHALEVRHASFAVPGFLDLLREHDIAVVVADTAGRWPLIREVTADFVYVRLHGDKELYTSGYSDEALSHWADAARGWAERGRDVFVYFDNDVKVRAPFDAMKLTSLVRGQESSRP